MERLFVPTYKSVLDDINIALCYNRHINTKEEKECVRT